MKLSQVLLIIFGVLVATATQFVPTSNVLLILTGVYTFFSMLVAIIKMLAPPEEISKLYEKYKPTRLQWFIGKILIPIWFVGSFTFICFNYGQVAIGSIIYSGWLVLRINEYSRLNKNIWNKPKEV